MLLTQIFFSSEPWATHKTTGGGTSFWKCNKYDEGKVTGAAAVALHAAKPLARYNWHAERFQFFMSSSTAAIRNVPKIDYLQSLIADRLNPSKDPHYNPTSLLALREANKVVFSCRAAIAHIYVTKFYFRADKVAPLFDFHIDALEIESEALHAMVDQNWTDLCLDPETDLIALLDTLKKKTADVSKFLDNVFNQPEFKKFYDYDVTQAAVNALVEGLNYPLLVLEQFRVSTTRDYPADLVAAVTTQTGCAIHSMVLDMISSSLETLCPKLKLEAAIGSSIAIGGDGQNWV